MDNDGPDNQQQQHQKQEQEQQHQGVVSDADLSNPSQQQALNQLNPYIGENVWPWHPMEFAPLPPPLPPHAQQALAMAHYHEACMKSHAAACVAWSAVGGITPGIPPSLPPAPHLHVPPAPFMPMPPAPHMHLPPAPHMHVPYGGGGFYGDTMPMNPMSPHFYIPSGELPFGSPRAATFSQHSLHDDDSDQEGNGRRRKRQQRMPPSSSAYEQGETPFVPPYAGCQASAERRGRRRLRSDAGSSGDNHDGMNRPSNRRHKEIQFGLSSSDGGGSSSVGGLHRHKKKQRQPSDASLLGKTGISALHEWCDKRRAAPIFVLLQDAATNNNLFEFAVHLDGKEWGRGRGGTKGSAKQEAARKALQNLYPGVFFDESGILADLPSKERETSKERKAKTSLSMLEDLGPSLAKSLAIGHDDDTSGRPRAGRALMSKRMRDVYPGTSTTSEDDDENTFYASKGAAICSTLLHAMVQIDDRIKDPPFYTYEVAGSNPQFKRKGVALNANASLAVHRGAFTCTASLRLEMPMAIKDAPVDSLETAEEATNQEEHESTRADGEEDVGETSPQGALENEAIDVSPSKSTVKVLEAVGMGGTKKEARHVASAQLLALLFPECKGMAEVKAAAEAAREKYAATKAIKLQSKKNNIARDVTKWQKDWVAVGTSGPLQFALPNTSDPQLDASACRQLELELGFEDFDDLNVLKGDTDTYSRQTGVLQVGRQKQLDELVDVALQNLNDKDEDGRCLHELSVDDVGRTVLRRAGPDDAHWVDKLLFQNSHKRNNTKAAFSSRKKGVSTRAMKVDGQASRFCPGPSITLLLCRAIAPHEDPPLGCAVLTPGFSMRSGKSLRVAQLANEPHLPRERLIECLQAFATNMKCFLDSKTSINSNVKQSDQESQPELVFNCNQLRAIVEAHTHKRAPDADRNVPTNESFSLVENQYVGVTKNTLQSVLEESEGSDESDKGNESSGEKRNAKQRDKPSKRSRVQ